LTYKRFQKLFKQKYLDAGFSYFPCVALFGIACDFKIEDDTVDGVTKDGNGTGGIKSKRR
jgi:hypothetical protein